MIVNGYLFHCFVRVQVDGVVVVSGSILTDDLPQQPWLLTQTLKQDDLVPDDEVVLPDGEWVVGVEEFYLTREHLCSPLPLDFVPLEFLFASNGYVIHILFILDRLDN